MEIDERYNLSFLHVEEYIAQTYREGIDNLRNIEDPEETLSILLNIFDSLEQSHPSKGLGVEWASEIIPAYRNLTKILQQIPTQEYNISSLFSEYSDLFSGYGESLPVEEKTKAMQLESAIKDLDKIRTTLKKHDYNLDEADMIFEKIGELEEIIKQHNQRTEKLESL